MIQYFAIGTIVLGIAIGYWQYTSIIDKEVSQGRVVELEPHRGSKGGTNYTIIAEFVDTAGVTQTYRSGFSSSSPGFKVGDPIRIYFDRNNPTKCGILSFGYRFGVAWILVVLGLALFLVAAGWSYGSAWVETRFPTTVQATQGTMPR